MNKENIDKLISRLEDLLSADSNPELGFNMAFYITENDMYDMDMSGHHCGTIACIAGHCLSLKYEDIAPENLLSSNRNTFAEARDWLGLEDQQALFLFLGYNSGRPLVDATVPQAITALLRVRDGANHEEYWA